MGRIQQLLTPLRDSIIHKPPYISGELQLPDSCFSLLYRVTKDGHAARHINLASATPDELEQLAQACEPASFGKNHENVLDETYRKAGKMDTECFSPMLDLSQTNLIKIIRGYLLEGHQSIKSIKAELYKLNVYGKGSFFKPHVDTPRSKNMFASLVIIFPTPHEGGALHLRHHGHEWSYDSGEALAADDQPSIGYVAFFSDIEHEVAPVISGHRVTLTYNLYFEDVGLVSSASAKDRLSEHLSSPNKGAFQEAFTALLENPEFMADGGTLAFGLRHVYPINDNLQHVYSILKGSDAVVYQSVRALGYEPMLYLYYEKDWPEGVIIDEVIDFEHGYHNDNDDTAEIVEKAGGIPVSEEGGELEHMEWVTPMTTFNRQEDVYPTYGNEPSLAWAYGTSVWSYVLGRQKIGWGIQQFRSYRGTTRSSCEP